MKNDKKMHKNVAKTFQFFSRYAYVIQARRVPEQVNWVTFIDRYVCEIHKTCV